MVKNTSPINYEIKNPDNSINDPFTITELNNCLFKKKSKSPGPDGIPFSFLQHLSSLSLNYLHNIFNNTWTKNHFPKQRKAAAIIPTTKPNKTNFIFNNYRPMSLLNTMSKILKTWLIYSTNMVL
uniref:RNA-directed DNA polymerase from mobile element jockey n=1 Tax=Sipha flava TaxID=143950 RepID=A0A2S2R888_9HEMI